MAKQLVTSSTRTAPPPAVLTRPRTRPRGGNGHVKGAPATRASARAASRPEPEPEVEAPSLKPRTVRLIDGIRAGFSSYVAEFIRFNRKAADIAPDFMKAYKAYEADTSGTFVSFVRMLDPEVPEGPGQPYKGHPTYNAADYLRRLVADEEREGEEVEDRDKPAGMSEAFVRLLAAIVALIPGNQVEKLWGIVGSELRWSERRVQTLREQVEQADPLLEAHPEGRGLAVEQP